jgi:hypothetical protein
VSASGQAQFPGGFAEYNSIPWDLGFGKAKEIFPGSRFMTTRAIRPLRGAGAGSAS